MKKDPTTPPVSLDSVGIGIPGFVGDLLACVLEDIVGTRLRDSVVAGPWWWIAVGGDSGADRRGGFELKVPVSMRRSAPEGPLCFAVAESAAKEPLSSRGRRCKVVKGDVRLSNAKA